MTAHGEGPARVGYDNYWVNFRINPNRIQVGWDINTNVIDTIGGRVVQVIGATPLDLTLTGQFGDMGTKDSRTMQEEFFTQIKNLVQRQSDGAANFAVKASPMRFEFPYKGWSLGVYIKDFGDPDGGGVQIRTGKFSHSYTLTLKVEEDPKDFLRLLGDDSGNLTSAYLADDEVSKAINRISDGIGWKASDDYNGPGAATLPAVTRVQPQVIKDTPAGQIKAAYR